MSQMGVVTVPGYIAIPVIVLYEPSLAEAVA